MTQRIHVTAGDVDYLKARVTERHGKPLDDTTWKVALGSYDQRPADNAFQPADLVEEISDSVRVVSLLVDENTPTGTGLYLWVLPTDQPTHRAYRVDTETIDIF